MTMTPEIQSLLNQYKTADKSKKAKIRRTLRAKGFSLRQFNKGAKKAGVKPSTKAPVKKAAPKKAAPKKEAVEATA